MSFRVFSMILISTVLLSGCGLQQLGPSQRHHFEHSALNFEFTSTYPRSREELRLVEAFMPGSGDADAVVVAASPVPVRAESMTRRTPRRSPVETSPAVRAPVVAEARKVEESELESLDDILGGEAPSVAALAPRVMKAAEKPLANDSTPEAGSAPAEASAPAPVAVQAAAAPKEPVVAARVEAPASDPVPAATEKDADAHQRSTDVRRAEIAEAARRLIGVQKDFTSESLLAHVLRVNGVDVKGTASSAFNRDFFRSLRNRGLSYDTERPSVGDIVFFHNTKDVNKDGRNNDWYSATGVITDVSARGTVTFVSVVNDEVRKLVMNLGRPEVRRDEAEQSVLNSYLRSRKMSDPEYTQYLAGELFAGYASVALP